MGEFIPQLIYGACILVLGILNNRQSKLIDLQKDIAKILIETIERERKENANLLKFCLNRIRKDAIASEDYETAASCRDALLKMMLNDTQITVTTKPPDNKS